MELGDAIKHAEAVAQAKEREAKENRNHGGWAYDDEATKCSTCAAEHRQLAEWLKELKELRKQKETIIDRLSEKFAYLNTCPNERDMIIRIVGGTSSNEIHCDTDCNHTDCKSYHFGFNVKKDKYE